MPVAIVYRMQVVSLEIPITINILLGRAEQNAMQNTQIFAPSCNQAEMYAVKLLHLKNNYLEIVLT